MADKLYKQYMDMWLQHDKTDLSEINIKTASTEARRVWAEKIEQAKENDIEFDKVWTEVLGDAHKLRAIAMSNIGDSYFLETIRPRRFK